MWVRNDGGHVMVAVNVEQLLEAISPESPCGEDLSYDPDYMELDRLAR